MRPRRAGARLRHDAYRSGNAELLLSAGAPPPRLWGGSGAAVPVLAVDRTPAELLAAIPRLPRLFGRPRDLPVLGRWCGREILWLLLNGPRGKTIRQLGLPGSKLACISRAVQWIRDNTAEPMRVGDLAVRADLSVSAFRRAFHAVTGVGPRYPMSLPFLPLIGSTTA